MTIHITALFVCLDDFSKLYEKNMKLQAFPSLTGKKQHNRNGFLSLSEMLLIQIVFHVSAYKDFNPYYLYGICHEHRHKFGKLPCYP